MKFFAGSPVYSAARLGRLSEFERMPTAVFETPHLMFYTKSGCFPHITKDVLQDIIQNQSIFTVSFPTTMTMAKAMNTLKQSYAEFVSMKEHIHVLTVQDPALKTPSGFQKLDSISIWNRFGRCQMDSRKYMEIIEILKPDMYMVLCDSDTNMESSKKRVAKAVQRSKTLLEQCIEHHNSSEALKNKAILGAIEGGFSKEARERSINYTKDKPLSGYVIDGLHNYGPEVKDVFPDEISNIVEHTMNLLPEDKLKASFGCWNPVTTLELIKLGVDLFESSYPYTLTTESKALTFMCDHECCDHGEAVITITEKQYNKDFNPICKTCECLTCKNHSRAYINHLCHTKEMLNYVLLMIHNIHQYNKFFEAIRTHLKNKSFGEFYRSVKNKFSIPSRI